MRFSIGKGNLEGGNFCSNIGDIESILKFDRMFDERGLKKKIRVEKLYEYHKSAK